MSHRLSSALTFCIADERALFLDRFRDRYFGLEPVADAAFQRLLADEDGETPAALWATGVLAAPNDPGSPLVPCSFPEVRADLASRAQSRRWPSWRHVFEVGFDLAWSAAALRFKGFDRSLAAARRLPLSGGPAGPVLEAASRFRAARLLIPTRPTCLRDTLALNRFLVRRHLSAAIVVGVKTLPFGAHCWIQHEHCVLNDTVDAARLFTPILTV